MEFIVCDAEKNEIMAISKSAEMDWDIGGTNDVQITCSKGLFDFVCDLSGNGVWSAAGRS